MVHLVYCDNTGKKGERVLDKILSETKTMVVRGAAGRKIPHSRVFEGETVYFMEKGTSSISAFATVKAVQNYVKLNEEEIIKTLNDNRHKLNLTEKQKERWLGIIIAVFAFSNSSQLAALCISNFILNGHLCRCKVAYRYLKSV